MRRIGLALVLLAIFAPSAQALPARFIVPARGHSHGIVLFIHGGGWLWTGQEQLDATRPLAESYTSLGWRFYSTTYRPGLTESSADVERVYRAIRRRHPHTKIVVVGGSAGGHLVLLLASRHPSLAAISYAGPTRLGVMAHGLLDEDQIAAIEGAEVLPAVRLIRAELRSHDRATLAALSPARHPSTARVLAFRAELDPLVGPEQLSALERWPHARLVTLEAGDQPWIHADISAAAVERCERLRRAFLRRVALR